MVSVVACETEVNNHYTPAIARESRCFTGTRKWYRYHRNFLLTEGVKWLAETLNCFWLLDVAASHCDRAIRDNNEWFFSIIFRSLAPGKGELIIGNGDGLIFTRIAVKTDLYIPTSQFDEAEEATVNVWCCYDGLHAVLMLPTEY